MFIISLSLYTEQADFVGSVASDLPLRKLAVNDFKLLAQGTILFLQLLDALPECCHDGSFGIIRDGRFLCWLRQRDIAGTQLLNARLECGLLIKPGGRNRGRTRHHVESDRLPLRQQLRQCALRAIKRRLMPRLRVLLQPLRVPWMRHVPSLVWPRGWPTAAARYSGFPAPSAATDWRHPTG